MTTLVHLGQLTPARDYTREYIELKRWALQKYGAHDWRAFNGTELPRIGRRDAITIAAWWADVAKDIQGGHPLGDDVKLGIAKMEVAAYGSAEAAQRKRSPIGAALDGELTTAQAAYFWEGMSEVAIALPAAKMRRKTLFDKGVLLWDAVVEAAVTGPRAHASYWDAFDLAASGRLSRKEIQRRADERKGHTEALGRIIASEAGSARPELMRIVGWIARNRSLHMQRPMMDMAAPEGQYGPITAKRPMSSSRPATAETRAIAAEVLAAPQSHDPTQGATHGFDTALQDSLAAQGITTNDADGVIEIWERSYGLKRVGAVDTWVLYR